ncbi:hypothetical protein Metev_0344 [Methanohalobium evestigatum Z-7303]|uniref:Uncharacterized protein n=1 Tax=Methanohalobium evestigatum (strain ATCC BAA-1072 / DSM 3721 / NBRC 107634 / OCM 161 / Z-7303) TaxID=644295 RepID=D7E6P7_METEZ|nr:hypothetical protein [Methanohalobium evestigatum]ADI73269.1 hypothetical protein Metev_0344 [Methanohalobium evestigatum Z-7303]
MEEMLNKKKETIRELAELDSEKLTKFSDIEKAVILACRELVNKGAV